MVLSHLGMLSGFKLADALNNAEKEGICIMRPQGTPGLRIVLGSRPLIAACDALFRRALWSEGGCAVCCSQPENLASDSRDLSLPISGLALRGRFVANQDVVEMNALCSELQTFIPAAELLNPNERWTAVFDLDDTVWAGHIMDLGILAVLMVVYGLPMHSMTLRRTWPSGAR